MIRYFEKLGVISPSTRTASGYRLFGPQHVIELQFVRQMQDLGFYAEQIRALRELKSSEATLAERREAIGKLFQDHTKHVEEKAAYFNDLDRRLKAVASDFVDRILGNGI